MLGSSEEHRRATPVPLTDIFEILDDGDRLILINDHEPKPLFDEIQAEVPEFDAEKYEVEQRDTNEFIAKKNSEEITVRL